MTDVFSRKKRSWVMSQIRGKDTKIEKKMNGILSELNYKFEMYPKMFGSPDFVLERRRIAIFCDGDFWHGFRYEEKKKPAKKFWRDKIQNNRSRDKKVSRKLRSDGWSVLRFWEHDIEKNPELCIRKLKRKAGSKKR